MKILLFTDSLGSGGAQRQLVGLATMLHERGYDVKVCTYHDFDFYKSFLDERGINNELIPGASNKLFRIWAVARYFKKEKPNWVIAYLETPSLVACCIKIMGIGFRLIVSERNTTQRMGINEYVRFFLYRFADCIVPNAYAQEKFLLKIRPWMRKKMKVIHNFVDLKRFSPNYKKRSKSAKFLIVGSISASKNTLLLIEACKILKKQGVKVRFLWYGWTDTPSEYMKESERRINEYQLSDMIQFKKKCKNIECAYKNAEYYCIPSIFEGTPNVLCEAIASGLPVVGSNVCDNARYIKNGYNGFLFNPYSPSDIAKSIEKLIALPDETYENFCRNSRRLAEQTLNQKIFLNKYISIFKS